jgi:hypothetical protein
MKSFEPLYYYTPPSGVEIKNAWSYTSTKALCPQIKLYVRIPPEHIVTLLLETEVIHWLREGGTIQTL